MKQRTDFRRYVLDGGPFLSNVVASHLLLENHLRRAIARRLVRPKAVLTDQGPSFAALVNLAVGLDVIAPDLAQVLRAINALRNRYAHRLGYEASQKEVESLLKALREMKEPFHVSLIPGSERELGLALASLTGWFEHHFGPLDAQPAVQADGPRAARSARGLT